MGISTRTMKPSHSSSLLADQTAIRTDWTATTMAWPVRAYAQIRRDTAATEDTQKRIQDKLDRLRRGEHLDGD